MIERGYDTKFANDCFNQIKGFGSYGFPESHAAAFAQLVYVSSWIKKYHPAAFACALLNSQPMGFYAPAQIIRDAQEHGAEILPADVNHSVYDNSLEGRGDEPPALRLGFRQLDGIVQEDAEKLAKRRGDGYGSIEEMRERGGVPSSLLRRLADADAFRSMGLNRRDALWIVRRLPDNSTLPLFAVAEAKELGVDPQVSLPAMALGEHVTADYQTARLSLKSHPMQILRPIFRREGILTCADTSALQDGKWARTAGIILVRQRPGTGNAIFITLEDETGITNVLLWAKVFEKFRVETMGSRLLLVEGRAQKSKEGVTHLIGERLIDRTHELQRLSEDSTPEIELSRGDEVAHPQSGDSMWRHPRNVRVLPKSRDFH
jgi:error-prone DNA polymerase